MLKSFLNRVADLYACSFIKNILQHRYFPVEFTKFLRKYDEHLQTTAFSLLFFFWKRSLFLSKILHIEGSYLIFSVERQYHRPYCYDFSCYVFWHWGKIFLPEVAKLLFQLFKQINSIVLLFLFAQNQRY